MFQGKINLKRVINLPNIVHINSRVPYFSDNKAYQIIRRSISERIFFIYKTHRIIEQVESLTQQAKRINLYQRQAPLLNCGDGEKGQNNIRQS